VAQRNITVLLLALKSLVVSTTRRCTFRAVEKNGVTYNRGWGHCDTSPQLHRRSAVARLEPATPWRVIFGAPSSVTLPPPPRSFGALAQQCAVTRIGRDTSPSPKILIRLAGFLTAWLAAKFQATLLRLCLQQIADIEDRVFDAIENLHHLERQTGSSDFVLTAFRCAMWPRSASRAFLAVVARPPVLPLARTMARVPHIAHMIRPCCGLWIVQFHRYVLAAVLHLRCHSRANFYLNQMPHFETMPPPRIAGVSSCKHLLMQRKPATVRWPFWSWHNDRLSHTLLWCHHANSCHQHYVGW